MFKKLICKFFILILFSSQIFSEGDRNNIRKINGTPYYTFFDINNISTFIYNNGGTDFNLNQGAGFEYPKGTRQSLVYSSGLLWGAKVNNEVRVGGSTFQQGLVGGKILPDGTAEDFGAPNVRVYRVRRDFLDFENRDNIDVSAEIFDQQGTAEQIRNQYIKDWNEWPAEDGAPYEDLDNNGIYNPEVDIPGIAGADQTIWYVANDLNAFFTLELYGSPPLGIEMHATFWGYSKGTPVDNIMFRRYVLINKSSDNFDEMYLSLWMDPDIGEATNDLVGCDTLLNLGYAYNSTYFDNTYGNDAPAIGFKLLQGPMVESTQNETAKFYGRKIQGMKNLSMSSFHHIFQCCPPKYGDPIFGVYDLGSLAWYEYMKGNLRTGEPFPVPERHGGGFTKFPYSGDPIENTGWLDGVDVEAGDRRLGLGIGPFTMAPGDTQEVIFAHIAAGGSNGVNSLTAVSLLKQYAKFAQSFYDSDFVSGLEITSPVVSVYEMDKAVGLTWGSNSEEIYKVEKFDKDNYKFQGYNIYQFSYPAEETKDAVKIATYDVVDGIVLQGNDSGIKRNIVINKNYFSNTDLVNGRKYYFGVTAYAYNPDAEENFKITESFPEILTVRPFDFSPGFYSEVSISQSINVEHASGNSNAILTASVISPNNLTGDSYKVYFSRNNENELIINVENENSSQILLSSLEIKDEQNQNITFDGISMEINNSSGGSQDFVPLKENDLYKVSTTKKLFDKTIAVSDAEEINVYPNPYHYNIDSPGVIKYPDFVTFNHLPQKAIIRIFNLNGQIMNTIEKDSASQLHTWDLFTQWGRRIPSGLYIIHIDLPEIGTTKILKLAVI